MFDYFNHKRKSDQPSDKGLTQKLLILLLLVGDQRMNAAYFSRVDRIIIIDIEVKFSPNDVFKHSKPGKKLDSFHYRAYQNKRLCAVDCLKKYLKYRSTKVQTDIKGLFIIYEKPFRAAAIDSTRRWVKDLFI